VKTHVADAITLDNVDEQLEKITTVLASKRVLLAAVVATFERTMSMTGGADRDQQRANETIARFRAAMATDVTIITDKFDNAMACVARAKVQRAAIHDAITSAAPAALLATVDEARSAAISGTVDLERLRATVDG
jgi:hypothetical protein